METMKKVNETAQRFFSRYGKTVAILFIFFMLLGTAQVVEAQSGLKINSLSEVTDKAKDCLLYTSPSPRDRQKSRMPSSA